MAKVILALGTNLGNRKENLKKAIISISRFAGKVLKETEILETKPFGITNQPYFLNQGILIETYHPPLLLLKILKEIEKRNGRFKTFRWGPRTIDIDILIYDDLAIKTTQLQIPHPGIENRDFFQRIINDFKSTGE
ncbi:2-amino-4-hydroxy-6-hydroxymethyldihydropteridine diphosphokinase [Desulfurobacterium atlanticum]|uniref:2-amino-4-hydroxy-6-hydroxymethyldihydropteridine pyrophosphokinase n=1 Tax=Desulfurobacterium atlanticum TaxID=240169 RepID=A0A238YWB8_9BACT|nr:2-amino-4-hydroxy-6-hydroxymethyldihydropteridine diphosphokinase [Desulfurobacterium atlanticum]SNR75021.1 2-amino-4-hydroxy-6-hydroxymethyldihydropteridinediphosphokinase [Desulfurobacterium atlanticum]